MRALDDQAERGAAFPAAAGLDRLVPLRARRARVRACRAGRVREPALRRRAEPRNAAAPRRPPASSSAQQRGGAARSTSFPTRHAVATSERGEHRAEPVHVRRDPVAVGLAAPRGIELVVVRARSGSRRGRSRRRERCGTWLISHTVSASDACSSRGFERISASLIADLLDPDRRPVQADGVTAADAERDELVDRAVAVDHEVRAVAGKLVQLRVGRVRGERVPGAGEALVVGEVLDDHVRGGELPGRLAVVR